MAQVSKHGRAFSAAAIDARAESPNVPDFDDEIFISYAHLDNEPPGAKGDEGWISNLHRALEYRVGQVRGAKPRIWRDPKLQGNDVFGQELIDRIVRQRCSFPF